MAHLSAFLCLALALVLTAHPARAQGLTSTLEMTGRAVIEASADVVHIELAARSVAANPCDALAADAGLAGRFAVAFGDLGVIEPDIETSDFHFATARQPDNPMANPPGDVEVALLDPDPPDADGGAQRDDTDPTLTCGPPETYRVDSAVTLTLRNLGALDETLARLGGMDGIEVLGLRYSLAETDNLFAQARRAALENAEGKAAIYAASMSLTVSEPITVLPGPVRLISATPAPNAEGVLRVVAEASVTLIYEVRWD